jgi:hypothetical protein
VAQVIEFGESFISQSGFDSGLAKLAMQHSSEGSISSPTQLIPLDSLDISPNALIKIDVEGHEYQVLQGGKQALSDKRPVIIFEHWECLNRPYTTLADFFDELGYGVFQINAELRNSESPKKMVEYQLTSPCLQNRKRYNLLAVPYEKQWLVERFLSPDTV